MEERNPIPEENIQEELAVQAEDNTEENTYAAETAGYNDEPVTFSFTDLGSAFTAFEKTWGVSAAANSENLKDFFQREASSMVREIRLLDAFLAVNGHALLLTGSNTVEGICNEMNREYWIDLSAAKMICEAFSAAFCPEASIENDSLRGQADRYYNGDGVAQDKEKAAELYEAAGNEGDMDAQYTLAYMYDKGDGIDKDRDKAMLWYEKAAEQGHESAVNRLAVLRRAAETAAQPKKKGLFGR